MNWFSQEGSASPLGATWIADEVAFNFALYSKYASEARVLLYSREDTMHPLHEYKFDPLINKSERVWHCRLRGSAISSATTEAGEDGPTYNFKGIDNSTYYLLEADRRHYRNDTMAGNTLNCANRYVRKDC